MSDPIWHHTGEAFGGATTRGNRKSTSVSRTAALKSLGSVVYAARLADGTIKIGCTRNFDDRLRWLASRVRQDVELLAFRLGDFGDESEIHRSLREYVHHGREWYSPTPAVIAVINEMRKPLGLDPLVA